MGTRGHSSRNTFTQATLVFSVNAPYQAVSLKATVRVSTASVDPATAMDIMKKLLSLKNKQRLIIIATHNPIIWEMADEVVSMDTLCQKS